MRHIPFDFDWTFTEGPDGFFLFAGADTGQAVDLPHDYVIAKRRDPNAAGGASTGFYPGGDGSYTKQFDLPESFRGRTVLLNVDGAYMNSEVTLNGDLLNLNPYGYTAYTVDLTRKLLERNTLKISTKCTQPNSRWYSGAGLYRQVGVWVGGKSYVHPWDVFVSTQDARAEKASVRAAFDVTNATSEYALSAEIADEAGHIVASAAGTFYEPRAVLAFSVKSPQLWDVDDPHLYTLKFSLNCAGETDSGEARFGIRKIEIDAKNGFLLNGKKMKLRGGCIHHDNAMLGACAFPSAECRKIRLLKDAGFNAIRTAHNPPSSALLDACDELGMLVLDESFDMWRSDFTPTPMTLATTIYYTGYNPYTLEKVYTATSPSEKLAQRQFFFWYKPEYRKQIIQELRKTGKIDYIDRLFSKK